MLLHDMIIKSTETHVYKIIITIITSERFTHIDFANIKNIEIVTLVTFK